MFSKLAQPQFLTTSGREYLWHSGVNQEYILAGAVLDTTVLRIRLLRGTAATQFYQHLQSAQSEPMRYQLVDDKEGSLPYHSWMVIAGDEFWPHPLSASDERALLELYLQGFAASPSELRLTRPLASNERIFGLGERTGDMNKRGQAFPIWNIDPHVGHNSQTETMYTSIPFYLGLSATDGRAYGVLLDHTGRVAVDMGNTHPSQASLTVQGDSLVVYYFMGPTPAAVMQQYTTLTGNMPLPPRWTLGHHQCRWSYASAQHVRSVATQFRQRNHPLDAIWLDIDYMDGYRDFTWNANTFPQPEALLTELHDQGIHLVTIIDPGVKIDEQYTCYQQGMAQNYFCHFANGELFTGNVWPGACVFPDFSQHSVRSWWGNLYQGLLNAGVDGIWNDMDEPALTNFLVPLEPEIAIQSNTMPDDVWHSAAGNQTYQPDGPPTQHKFFHNAYGMEMARATYEGLLHLQPNSRPFVMTRSGTAGVQRYAAVWTGDNSSLWEHILLAMPMCLNLSMSGVAFIGIDIGGFWYSGSGELLTRFAQLGALLPFCRNHNALGNPDQEPWSFGEPFESAYRTAMEVRYKLLPYLYTLFHEAATTGAPIIRPLYYHYPQDEQACDTQDEFLVGDTLLSAPIYEQGTTSRNVYLPEGIWFDYWTGQEYSGNAWHEIAAPLERWPLFIHGNCILPTGPMQQFVDQLPTDPLTLTCYMATDGLANYTLYEDDGSTLAYQQGTFAETAISCRVQEDFITLEIEERWQAFRPQRTAYEIIVLFGNRTLQQRVPAGQGKVKLDLKPL